MLTVCQQVVTMPNMTMTDSNPPKKGATRAGRKTDSRRRLLDAARALFVTRGYHATRPQDITKEAGLGHGTFYIHFKDKRDCYLAFQAEAQDALMAQIEKVREATPATAEVTDLTDGFSLVFDVINQFEQENPGLLGAAMQDASIIAADEAPERGLIDNWAEQWTSGLEDGVAAGMIRKDVNLKFVGYAIVGMLQTMNYYQRHNNVDYEDAKQDVLRFLRAALRTRD